MSQENASSTSAPTLDPAQQVKFDTARQKKDVGDQAFKSGDVQGALRSYHEALMYLHGLNTTASQAASPAGGESTKNQNPEIDEMLEKIYNNMSACHMKQGNWQRALDTADKALKKNEKNYKALFRKGKALGELGYFEKSEKILEDLLQKNPSDAPIVNHELTRLRAVEKERERVANKKFKGFLLKEKKAEPVAEARIEEITDP
ncbi:TPR-like protein [Heliocybe sulcata]|uniref:TPR-like protein n=1 Tax=Heliocybe sulcata TaxID=5364 RepID=A0A5C3MWN1_9AGAM|nr:TPR-like protein [Heliocybe sulcata]